MLMRLSKSPYYIEKEKLVNLICILQHALLPVMTWKFHSCFTSNFFIKSCRIDIECWQYRILFTKWLILSNSSAYHFKDWALIYFQGFLLLIKKYEYCLRINSKSSAHDISTRYIGWLFHLAVCDATVLAQIFG